MTHSNRSVRVAIFSLLALALLTLTADRGGNLVYGHGLGVHTVHAESSGNSR